MIFKKIQDIQDSEVTHSGNRRTNIAYILLSETPSSKSSYVSIYSGVTAGTRKLVVTIVRVGMLGNNREWKNRVQVI